VIHAVRRKFAAMKEDLGATFVSRMAIVAITACHWSLCTSHVPGNLDTLRLS
jgi:hypothetical protein